MSGRCSRHKSIERLRCRIEVCDFFSFYFFLHLPSHEGARAGLLNQFLPQRLNDTPFLLPPGVAGFNLFVIFRIDAFQPPAEGRIQTKIGLFHRGIPPAIAIRTSRRKCKLLRQTTKLFNKLFRRFNFGNDTADPIRVQTGQQTCVKGKRIAEKSSITASIVPYETAAVLKSKI